MNRFLLASLLIFLFSATGLAADRGEQHGKALLETMCSRCHAIGRTGRYDEDFVRRLQHGLSTMHPDMPTFHFSRQDAEDAVDYLRSIQMHDKPAAPSGPKRP